MRFAFLIHPINAETSTLWNLGWNGAIRESWGGTDILEICAHLHEAAEEAEIRTANGNAPIARIVDELGQLVSVTGASAEGRVYEIPMKPEDILNDPQQALNHMRHAVRMAEEWGAEIVGLGSMTGIVAGRGTYLAESSQAAITTGNSLTVYSALQNAYRVIDELGINLQHETVAVVGVPGSIASAIAALISPQCRELILVGRQPSSPARKLANELDAELILDIKGALSRSSLIFSATSTGGCIDEKWLRSGSIVIDIGVPADVKRGRRPRKDILALTGGFVCLPQSMVTDSIFLWFQQGVVPSCLGETIALALSGRAESLSLGRGLDLDSIQEIGMIAQNQGLDFSQLYSCGRRLDDSRLVSFQKTRPGRYAADGTRRGRALEELAERAGTRYGRHINPVLTALGARSDFIKTFVRGEGTYLYDKTGNRYLDFVSGFGSLNLGHNHPKVVEAINSALLNKAPGFAQTAINPYTAALAETLVSVVPEPLEMVFFTNSGTEAVEASLKLARKATGRTGLLACRRGFHGKTMGALSLAGNPEYRQPFTPLVPECEFIPFDNVNALERALTTEKFAAFIVEPIQAEGGFHVPQAGYLRKAQALCRATGTLLIVDEVQTGFGRTGSMFAVEHEDVAPDIMAIAKSLGGGLMPIGAMLARRDLWMQAYGKIQSFALHSNTFGGGSLASVAGLATLETISNEGLCKNAAERGGELYEGLKKLCDQFACVREVRGRGLLLGLAFEPLYESIKTHWKDMDRTGMTAFMVPGVDRFLEGLHINYVMQTLLHDHKIYTQTTRSDSLVLRIQPALTITREQISYFLDSMEKACSEIDRITRTLDVVFSKASIGEIEDDTGPQTESSQE